ncbi:uncharacterized protein CTRU02_201016 [Colletotrichum truncatum]|uniref:Uncharacterized protein n=1 Tax=Colletotrichum truncatum TaxID=5467 RepID=A0ACC3ZG95_COLTU
MSNMTLLADAFGSKSSQSLPTDTRQPLVIGIASMFIVITIFFMAVRVYIRGYELRAWRLDDSMYVWSCVSSLDATQGPLGVHIWNMTAAQFTANGHFVVASVLMYQVSFNFVKATVLLQYRRAFAVPYIKHFCDIFLLFIFLIMTAMLIACGLILRVFLQPVYILDGDDSRFLIFGYVNAAVNLITDIIIFILPVPLIARLSLGTMQKAGLIASFGVGIFTCVISILRITSLSLGTDTSDVNYQGVPLVLLSVAEPTSGIVCACVPLLRPFLVKSGSSRIRKCGKRKTSGVTDDSSARKDLEASMPPQSPTSLPTA